MPRMLHEILATRVMVKSAMKRAPTGDKARASLIWKGAFGWHACEGCGPAGWPFGALQRRPSSPRNPVAPHRPLRLARLAPTRPPIRPLTPSPGPTPKNPQVLQRVLNARQFGLKLIANVTYGYTSASFSGRMPMAELADSIVQARCVDAAGWVVVRACLKGEGGVHPHMRTRTHTHTRPPHTHTRTRAHTHTRTQTGRQTLQNAIQLVESHPDWRGRVVYGDTGAPRGCVVCLAD